MNRLKRWLLRITFFMLILVGLGIGGYAFLYSLAEVRLKQEIDRVAEKGESLFFTDLVPAPPPQDRNGAVRYERAVAFIVKASPEEISAYSSLKEDLMGTAPEVAERVHQWLEKNRACMEILEEGLAKTLFHVEPIGSHPLDLKLPNMLHHRHFTSLFIAKALLQARAGHEAEALTTCCQAIRLGRTMNTAPFFISFLVLIACEQFSLDCLERVLEGSSPPAKEILALGAELAALDPFEIYARALEGERCFGFAVFESLKAGSDTFTDAEDPIQKAGFSWPCWPPDPFLRLDQARFLEEMARLLEHVRNPNRALQGEWNGEMVEAALPWYCALTRDLFPTHDPLIQCTKVLSARIGLARIFLGLMLHRLKHRCLPESLEGLDGDLLGCLPADPFSGAPFRYRVRPEGGFLLYSVGKNRRDDHGEKGQNYEAEEGDIVWTWALPRVTENR